MSKVHSAAELLESVGVFVGGVLNRQEYGRTYPFSRVALLELSRWYKKWEGDAPYSVTLRYDESFSPQWHLHVDSSQYCWRTSRSTWFPPYRKPRSEFFPKGDMIYFTLKRKWFDTQSCWLKEDPNHCIDEEPPTEFVDFKCTSEQERLNMLEQRAKQMGGGEVITASQTNDEFDAKQAYVNHGLLRHEIEVGSKYMYSGHEVEVLFTYHDKYLKAGYAIVEDTIWRAINRVPISDLSLPVPGIALSYINNIRNTHGILKHSMLFISEDLQRLRKFLEETTQLTKLEVEVSINYIREALIDESISETTPSE